LILIMTPWLKDLNIELHKVKSKEMMTRKKL